jgi:hypothetical protein
MSSTKTIWIAATAVAIASALATGAPAASAAKPHEAERHCVIAVTAVHDGVLVTAPEVCFATPAHADRHAASMGAEQAGSNHTAKSSGTNTIGTHFTSTSYRGSSVRIVGTTCNGGVWYPTGTWNNNIESSRHHCGTSPTSFYDYSSCAGSSHRIYQAASSLGQLNNRASCVRYG